MLRNPSFRINPQFTMAVVLVLGAAFAAVARGQSAVAKYDVTWGSLGKSANDSMPLGNGDIALNAWTEQNGDIVLLIAKADSWSENGELLKLGRVRISMTPNPFTGASFSQALKLEDASVEFRAGNNVIRTWVDANHPVIHVDAQTEAPVEMKVSNEVWRNKEYHFTQREVDKAQLGYWAWNNDPNGLTFDPDTILPAKDNTLAVCHFNKRSLYPVVFEQEHLQSLLPNYPDPLLHRCFGISLRGEGLVSADDQTLKSSAASRSQRLDIYALTQQVDSPDAWRAALNDEQTKVDATSSDDAWKAHQRWWVDFWDRSWIQITGTPQAERVAQGYAMQRYMTACAGRGAQPIKFNGSLFTVGHDLPEGTVPTVPDHDPDYRRWGACYWNQNCRHIYWPLIASGDYDLIAPWFNMYVSDLPLERDRTRLYFHHDGGAFIETIFFWGLPNVNDFGWNHAGPQLSSSYMRYHTQGGLEVLAQMLDDYDNTQDAEFARRELLPLADTVITFYEQHWPRDPDGKIRMSPWQAIETYQRDAVNPTPDIAGLKSALPRLLALPEDLTSAAQRQFWTKVSNDLPPIPMGTTAKGKLPPKGVGDADGTRIILPAQKYGTSSNIENPELYTVFPYRLYGIGKPDLQLARDTFAARLFPIDKCWGQDGMEGALLGLIPDAKKAAITSLTSYGSQRFRWFWSQNMDYSPDMDNGGGGMMTLQLMLMQCDGKRIQLIPAWPKDWTADFKLHAPYQTTIQAHVEDGKLTNLQVTPQARATDVIIAAQQ